ILSFICEKSDGKRYHTSSRFLLGLERPELEISDRPQDPVLHCSWGGCEWSENQTLERCT
ncbi:MAG TPA: hypothetical protein VFZ29_07700, partial [Solirubrobacterales bacterium]